MCWGCTLVQLREGLGMSLLPAKETLVDIARTLIAVDVVNPRT